MSAAALAWMGVRNVLCVSLGAVRDLALASPAIRAIKQARPGRRVTVLTSRAGAAVARMIPEVDDVVAYDAPWTSAQPAAEGSARDLAMVERLRIARFGGVVIFTGPGRSAVAAALLCHLADIPLRGGYSAEDVGQLLTTRLAEEAEAPGARADQIGRQLRLAEAIGCAAGDRALSLRVPEESRGEIDRLVADPEPARGARPADVERPLPSAAERAPDEDDLTRVVGVVLDEPVEHPEDGGPTA
jgi:ADP-heptose:LPS heptosyltransferase